MFAADWLRWLLGVETLLAWRDLKETWKQAKRISLRISKLYRFGKSYRH